MPEVNTDAKEEACAVANTQACTDANTDACTYANTDTHHFRDEDYHFNAHDDGSNGNNSDSELVRKKADYRSCKMDHHRSQGDKTVFYELFNNKNYTRTKRVWAC